MRSFHGIAQAVVFSSNEIALFHALLYTWNAARRPAVIEQWADTTSRNAGMTPKVLRDSRNKLVQKGVIFYAKTGNRGVPKYSFNALFEKESPFLQSEMDSMRDCIRDSKRSVSGTVNGHSYQEKEKKKERPPNPQGEWDGVFPSNSLRKSKTEQKRTKVLRNNEKMAFVGQWFSRKPETLWTVAEAKALKELDPTKEEVREMAAWRSQPYDYHRHDLLTLLNNWHGDLDKARSWKPNIENKQQQRAEGMRDLNSI